MQKKKEILERANNKPNYSITHDMTNIYTEAFSIFFKIGAFTIGGGYAMVPLIEDEIVTKRRWIAKEDFIDLLAIAQSAPGHPCGQHIHIHRLPPAWNTGKHRYRPRDDTTFFPHYPCHSLVFP